MASGPTLDGLPSGDLARFRANRLLPEGRAKAREAAWVEWLRAMRWDLVATNTFARPVEEGTAFEAMVEWLRPFPTAYAAIGLQRGPVGGRLHVHAVVGGIGRHPLRANFLRGRWRRGDLQLDGYTPLKGFVEYLVAQADQIALVGTPRIYRPKGR